MNRIFAVFKRGGAFLVVVAVAAIGIIGMGQKFAFSKPLPPCPTLKCPPPPSPTPPNKTAEAPPPPPPCVFSASSSSDTIISDDNQHEEEDGFRDGGNYNYESRDKCFGKMKNKNILYLALCLSTPWLGCWCSSPPLLGCISPSSNVTWAPPARLRTTGQ